MDERARVRENPNMRHRSPLVWLVVLAACAPTETAFLALEDEPCARDEFRRSPQWARDIDGNCVAVSVCSSASTRATPPVATGGPSFYCYQERSTRTRVVFREQDADVLLSSGFDRCAELPEPCE